MYSEPGWIHFFQCLQNPHKKKIFNNKFAQVSACAYICSLIPVQMEARRDVFQAIADPTRRQIIDMISHHPLNVNAIAEKFDVSRQAVSLHVKILNECGLITIKQQGRERYCEASLSGLNEVSVWIEQYRQSWESKFDSLEKYLNKLQKNKRNAKGRK
jgi:DNA-binding transcriptional ArsR family regulator